MHVTNSIFIELKIMWLETTPVNVTLNFCWTSLVADTVKHLPAVWETQVQSLGWEDPLEKEMATHSSILAWQDRGAWQATVHGIAKSQTRLKWLSTHPIWFQSLGENVKWKEPGVNKKDLDNVQLTVTWLEVSEHWVQEPVAVFGGVFVK